jgi:hypothetical protein
MEAGWVQGLSLFGHTTECVRVGAEIMSLPHSLSVSVYVIIFAAVQWTDSRKASLVSDLEEVSYADIYACLLPSLRVM